MLRSKADSDNIMLLKSFAPKLENYWSNSNERSFSSITSGSRYHATWQCLLGHTWKSRVSNISSRYQEGQPPVCPFCSNRETLSGFNDLLTLMPSLAAQWHPVNNKELTPNMVTPGSSKKVWWQCVEGHEWEASLVNRKLGTNCPACFMVEVAKDKKRNNRIKRPANPLPAKYFKEWHPTKNSNLNQSFITAGSAKKVWWQCEKEHEWETSPNKRVYYDSSCPTCSGFKILKGFNDLGFTHPELVKEWDFVANIKTFTSISQGSKYRASWVCSKNHHWVASVYKRTSGQGCPYCANQKIMAGYNDLQSLFPALAEEWSVKNLLKISEVGVGSERKAFWCCVEGHEWEAQIRNRTLNGTGCPKCNSSSGEFSLNVFLETFLTKEEIVTHDRLIIKPYEIDFYIPSKKIAIEYNGIYWHSEAAGKSRSYHYDKWLKCKEAGVQLIQIWEDDWLYKRTLVEQMLKHKLNESNTGERVYARKTETVQLQKNETTIFLNNFHIQGNVEGSVRVGLKVNGVTVAVMVLRAEEQGKKLNLLRYATNTTVVGGFTKLLSFVIKNNPVVENIVTFSDNTVSDGSLYRNNGFVEDAFIKADYMYLHKGQRKHKFGYRLNKFKTNPDLIYSDNLSESELAKLNNISRIWDAGKIRWVKKVEPK